MKKEIPKVYANKIDKKIENNCKVCVTKNGVIEKEEVQKDPYIFEKDIHQKIKEIFNSSKYVYKADVVITLKDGSITKRIIGKNNSQLITIDNELIPIENIIDIEFKDEKS